ncbi:M20 family metallopeptidase [Clostridium neuense]|uniref:M20 family metallopeptidase n=1 Tax=Clostridium neuense TaxID=1728934 RepID=A0ABW8TQA0_9CLOT
MNKLLEEAKALQNTLIKHRRYIHENAEIEMELPCTTKYVMDKLVEMSYEPKEICKSGVVAIAGGKNPGKTFLLRADMDALPIIEETDEPFKSKTNYMHACGHDLHTAMLLGAAKILKEHEDEIEGTVKLMFQPAEEPIKGAQAMLKAGVLENPKVDAAMMIHVATGTQFPSGLLVVRHPGIISSASDWFTIKVKGKGGHSSSPNLTIDPLNVISHIFIALESINARELAPADNAAITVGQMHGGNTSNVIPDTAFLSGTIRTFNNETRLFIKKRLEEISLSVAKTFRAEAVIEYSCSCPSLINDAELVKDFKSYTSSLVGDDKVVDADKAQNGAYATMTGSEDFGYVTELVPSIMIGLTTGSTADGYVYPHHHPKTKFDESPLYIGAAAYANMAIEWLKNNK